jgi:hypothetical protein
MNVYVHNDAKKEVLQLLKAIRHAKRTLDRSPKTRAIRNYIIDEHYRRLGELVEAGLIAFIDK